MPTPIVMPQMGESIAEGTIVRWIKKVGDRVERDEPLFEITTDKVDAEIPAPAAGVLAEIAVKEGETVAVNSVVGTIVQPADAESASAPEVAAAPRTGAAAAMASTGQQGDGQPAGSADSLAAPAQPAGQAAKVSASTPVGERRTSEPKDGESAGGMASVEERRRRKSSPLVRRIARDNDVDITRIPGSGVGGRVTKQDILGFLDRNRGIDDSAEHRADVGPAADHQVRPGERVEIRPLSPARKKIAEHMVLSRRTSAHVHSVFHVDFSQVDRIRRDRKDEYASRGARLTYMAFIAKTVVDALRRHPVLNASLDADNVVYRKDVNLGIAVALEAGLVVPVIKNADEKSLLGLSRAIADVADRARAKQLMPDEVHDGTFTITNPGQFGAQFGMPIIHQPQVAILGVGTIEKRPVVSHDAIAIRTMAYLTLGFDHRLVDGAVADQFMSDVKKQIEEFDLHQV